MRLTLRTMLAYLDGVLEPADAALLGKKIDESKFATDLVARIRAVVKKSRLNVPRLDGKGMGLDPNTVADYLENLLPPDRVPDFEKVCLESDQHLAEVAACHQILTMVLGQPADINPASRERMYRVGTRAMSSQSKRAEAAAEQKGKPKLDPAEDRAVPTAKSAAAAPVREQRAPADERPPREQPVPHNEKSVRDEKPKKNERASHDDHPHREKPEVPDYLRESRRRRVWPLLLTVVFAFLLAAVLLRAMGPFNREHPLASLIIGKSPEVAQGTPDPNGNKPATPIDAGGKKPGEADPAVMPDDEPEPADGGLDKMPPDKLPPEPAPENPTDDPPAVDPSAKPASTLPGVDTGKPAEPKRPVDPDEPDFGDVPAPPKRPGKPVDPIPEGPATPAAPAKPGRPGAVVGRFISDQQVLARFDAETGEWFRLPKEASLTAGDKLLVLPAYRPQILLVSGLQLTLSGESLIELLPSDEKGVAQLKIEYGKVSILTSGKPGAQIGLNLGKHQGTATFDNVDSTLAVEVRNYRYPGDFPDKVAPHLIAELFATSGKINWTEGGTAVESLTSDEILTFLDDKPGEVEALTETPDWVKGRGLKEIELTAARTLAEKLAVDRSLFLSLQERAEPSKEIKVEVRSLAIRSLMYLDEFEPFVHALGDEKLKSFWYSQYDTAQEALARGPESAAQLKKAFESVRTEDAASLYRLLIGYSPDELNRSGASSGATKLIEFLEHESLDIRVLASETLLRITGKSLSYRPEVALPRRNPPISRWKQELKAGTLVYKALPSPLVERKAAGKAPAPAKDPPKEPAPEPSGR